MFKKSGGTSPVRVSPSVAAHPWEQDQERVTSVGAVFPVKYLGVAPVSCPRGVDVCEKAVKSLHYGKNKKRMQLTISVEGIRAVELSSKSLVIDQPIHKISFCSPDPNNDRIFSYICREGSTKRWLCYVFVAFKGYTGERLSHAMGCAFAAKVKLKKEEEKQLEQERTAKKKKTKGKKKSTKSHSVETSDPVKDTSDPSEPEVQQLRQFHQERQKLTEVDQSGRLKMESFESLESLEKLGLSSSDHSFDEQLDEIISSRTSSSNVNQMSRDASSDVLILQGRDHHDTNPWGSTWGSNMSRNNNTVNPTIDPWGGTNGTTATTGNQGGLPLPDPPSNKSKLRPHHSPSSSPILESTDDTNGGELSFEAELDSIVASRSSPLQTSLQNDVKLVSPPEQDTNPWGTFQDLTTTAGNDAIGNNVTKETKSSKQGDVPLLQQPPKRTRPRPSLKAATPTHSVTAPPTIGGSVKSKNVVDIKDDDDFISLLERELHTSHISTLQPHQPSQPPQPPQPHQPHQSHQQATLGGSSWSSSPVTPQQPVLLPPEQPTIWSLGSSSASKVHSARWPY